MSLTHSAPVTLTLSTTARGIVLLDIGSHGNGYRESEAEK